MKIGKVEEEFEGTVICSISIRDIVNASSGVFLKHALILLHVANHLMTTGEEPVRVDQITS